MGKIITAAAFLALMGASAALAQYNTKGGSSDPTVDKSSRYNAPIGHRQPRPSDLPPEARDATENPAKVDPADAALDRKIKSICRGC